MSEVRVFVPEVDVVSPPWWRRGVSAVALLASWWGEGLLTILLLSLSAAAAGLVGGIVWVGLNILPVLFVPGWSFDRALVVWLMLWPGWSLVGVGRGAVRLRMAG